MTRIDRPIISNESEVVDALADDARDERERREHLLREIEAIERDLLADFALAPSGSIRARAHKRKATLQGAAEGDEPQLQEADVPPPLAAAPVEPSRVVGRSMLEQALAEESAALKSRAPALADTSATNVAPPPAALSKGLPPTNNRPPQPSGNTPARGSLLDQLRVQALNQLEAEKLHKAQIADSAERQDKALREMFAYCHDLAQQLNILHPPVTRRYTLSSVLRLEDLVWQGGRADYRTDMYEEFAHVKKVSFSWLLAGSKPEVIEKEGPDVDRFRRLLFDYGIPFEQDDVRNSLRRVERARFTVSHEVRVGMRWEADGNTGQLKLTITNLERFGVLDYQVVPEAVTSELLEEMARNILGQPNRFLHLLTHPPLPA